jgi:hypothetical protein
VVHGAGMVVLAMLQVGICHSMEMAGMTADLSSATYALLREALVGRTIHSTAVIHITVMGEPAK